MAPPGRPALLSVRELARQLSDPFALEHLALSSTPMIAVELGDAHDMSAIAETVPAMAAARAVLVGVANSPLQPSTAEFASQFDILLAAPDHAGEAMVAVTDVDTSLDGIAQAVHANPQASVAMAELLRMEAYEAVPQGLVAESLTYSTLQSGPEFARWLADRGPAGVPDDPDEPLVVQRNGTSLDLTLNRPHRANAVTAAMRDRLVEALRVAEVDPTVDGVVLRGAGASFCSGGDLAEFGSTPNPATGHATRLTRSPAWWLHRLARDVRAHLHGACIGAGIELPTFAGTVVAAEDTTIRLPEIAMGLVPGAGGTVSLPRRIGRYRTAYLAITGRELDAFEALAWGIVDRLDAEDPA